VALSHEAFDCIIGFLADAFLMTLGTQFTELLEFHRFDMFFFSTRAPSLARSQTRTEFRYSVDVACLLL